MTEPRQPDVEPGMKWQYLGIGCLTLAGGLFGGGMMGVLAAKIAGWAQHCVPDPETGAPCGWVRFWFWGALIGGIGLPTVTIIKLRRGRAATEHSDRG
jgi:hypothetical protein